MRKFQRAAVVAVAVTGLSAFGAGVSFAGENPPVPVSAVANSSATALAVGGGYYAQPQQPQAQPEQKTGPEEHQAAPEQDYGQHGEGQHEGE
ncbi:hypothetical protein ACIP2X_18375 [Streptomyces sp. NPDC089424]|uniref:hypothetical protein n=1 Tax=Streptomyces sp. NPDC089424 TaxID=3365917 RepID=UPI00382B116E